MEVFTVEIKAGTILRGPQWPEPVEVNYSEDLGEYIRIVGVTIHARVHVDRLIKKTDLPEAEGESLPLFGAEPRSVFLSLEAKRYRFASLYDPLLGDDVLGQRGFVIRPTRCLALCRSMLPEHAAHPPLGHRHHGLDMIDTAPSARRAQKFPLEASCRISLSKVRSDTARRNRAFSFSSSFIRRA